MPGTPQAKQPSMVALDRFGWVGHTVANKLHVEAVVAEGGFAVVYRARHLGFDGPVALKCLKVPAQLAGEERERFLGAFLDEGKLLHRLSRSHLGIVQALDVGAAVSPSGAWTPYLALEWLEGTSLDDDMVAREARAEPPRPLAEIIELLDHAAEALGVAHAQGVAHRDIKPANLFLAEVGGRRIVKVVDFGIAKVMSDAVTTSGAHAQTGATLPAFSPRYGAPEQFDRGYGATGPWTDVFAFALVVVELLTGHAALDGDDTLQLFVASTNPERRPTPRAHGVHVSDGVERVLARALAVQPADRYAAIDEMWSQLKAAAEADAPEVVARTMPVPSTAPPASLLAPAAPAMRLQRPGRRFPARALATGAAAVTALALTAVALFALRDGPPREGTGAVTTLTSSGRLAAPAPGLPSGSASAAASSRAVDTSPASHPSSPSPSPSAPVAASAPARRPVPPGGMVRASHILVAYAGASASDQTRSREEARARAEAALLRVRQGADFVQLAAEYGDDATRARGGDLGAFSREKFPAAFTGAAFALEPGATSAIVETRYGFHIIRRTQ